VIADRERAEEWADRIAASLPPLTPAEAAEAGQFRATIDARRHEQQQATTKAA
jgi:hypothetical protein